MNAWIASFLLALTWLASPSLAGSLRPFQTDGCTRFPDGRPDHQKLWRDCCVQHDLYLWAGGSKEERLAVDRQLKECVISKGAPVPAWVMYLGVRIGAQSPVRYKEMEWGNAWTAPGNPVRPRYLSLNSVEMHAIFTQITSQKHPDLSDEQVRLFLISLANRL